MREQPTYHIDTTQEEDNLFKDLPSETKKSAPLKQGGFAKIFYTVFGIHLIGAGLVSLSTFSANADTTKETNKAPEVAAPIAESYTTPVPAPTPVLAPVVADKPATKAPIQQTNKPVKKDIAKSYVVKKGDTIHSIAKKYKLSSTRLIQINNIKDTNKIIVGQVLKF